MMLVLFCAALAVTLCPIIVYFRDKWSMEGFYRGLRAQNGGPSAQKGSAK